ncbi:Cystatin-F Cystatin-7 [Collichthys lucidus]|uniref:Cystatin-F Cystatin-7 n=1 Tax=Collichthys lucidus TaxID=240159 RepID=A0A4U5TXG2_COLLU|nr:Cystatin-F Cystatin-7 [Collichthys lucidus]
MQQFVPASVKRAGLWSECCCFTGNTDCIMGVKTLLLVALLVALEVALVAGRHHGASMPGSPFNISKNSSCLKQLVLIAAYSFNNQSNDAFLFKASVIHRAQRQVVRGIRYIIDLDLSRTVCRKQNSIDLSNCDFQSDSRLNQRLKAEQVGHPSIAGELKRLGSRGSIPGTHTASTKTKENPPPPRIQAVDECKRTVSKV